MTDNTDLLAYMQRRDTMRRRWIVGIALALAVVAGFALVMKVQADAARHDRCEIAEYTNRPC